MLGATHITRALLGAVLLMPLLGQTWQEQMATGRSALQSRAMPEARSAFEGVRAEALQKNNPEAGLASVRSLILIERIEGNWPRVEELLNEAVDFASRSAGANSMDVAGLMGELAMARRALGRYPEAIASQNQAVELRMRVGEADASALARDLTSLGMLYLENKEEDRAKSILLGAVRTWEQAMREDPEILTALEALAGLYRNAADYAAAEPLYLRALRIREMAFGPGSAEMIAVLDSLSYVYFGQKKFAEAEPLYTRLLAIWEVSAGPDHPMVASTLDKMVEFYVAQERFTDAVALADRALLIRAKGYRDGLRARARVAATQGDNEASMAFGTKAAMFTDLAGLPKPEQKILPAPKDAKPVKPKPAKSK